MDLKSGYPFLLIKSGLPYDYPKLEQNIKTDIVIIGSGISGALSAYYLTRAGFNCVVVDARTVGLGSTCVSTSLLQYELDKPLSELTNLVGSATAQRAYRLCSDAIDEIEEICTTIGFDSFHRRKSLYYAAYKKHAPLLEKEHLLRKQAGFDVELLSTASIIKRYGFPAPSAILSAQGATIDAYTFTHALHRHSIKKGLRLYDRTRIVRTTYHQKSVELHTENNHTIHAKKIVNATGYEAERLIPGIAALHSTYAVCSEQMPAGKDVWKGNDLIWNTADPYLYLRTTDDNRIIIGGRDEAFYHPSLRDRLLKYKSKQLVKDFNKLFPETCFIPEFSWTGTFGTTSSSLPYIGSMQKFPHTYFALGFGGNGITFSLIAARIICDIMLGKQNKDAAMFSFGNH